AGCQLASARPPPPAPDTSRPVHTPVHSPTDPCLHWQYQRCNWQLATALAHQLVTLASSEAVMDLSNCTTVSPKYVERLSLYYSHVTGHVITADGKLLLAAIKAGYLAVFPIRSYLKDIFLSSEISSAADGNSGDQPLTNCAKRLKPISLIQMSNSLSLQLDKAPPKGDSSQYKLVTGGQGTEQFNSFAAVLRFNCCCISRVRARAHSVAVESTG